MIIGTGLIAKSLRPYDREDTVFIASGVSDSKCQDDKEFIREKELVNKVIDDYSDKKIVFFSTYSINDPAMKNNMYVQKKIELENYLSKLQSIFYIIRISNLVGYGGNPSNVFNFLFNKIKSGELFILWPNAERNLVLVEDFAFTMNNIITDSLGRSVNTISNIINPVNYNVKAIVSAIEIFLNKKANYHTVDVLSTVPVEEINYKNFFARYEGDTSDYLYQILSVHYSK